MSEMWMEYLEGMDPEKCEELGLKLRDDAELWERFREDPVGVLSEHGIDVPVDPTNVFIDAETYEDLQAQQEDRENPMQFFDTKPVGPIGPGDKKGGGDMTPAASVSLCCGWACSN